MVYMGQKFFIGIKKEIKMNKKFTSNKVIIIVALAFVSLLGASILAFVDFGNGISSANAQTNEKIIGTITYLGELPWNVEEYSLRAIVICDGQKIFVKGGEKFGTSIIGCSYYMASGIEVEYSPNFLTGDGKIYFKKIVTTTE